MKKIFFLSVVVLFIAQANAQLTISGEFRPRAELRHGYSTLHSGSDTPAYFVSQRSRINLMYQKDKLKTMFSFQDARVWGDEKFKSDVPGVSVNEAWFEMKIKENLELRIGRQALDFDNSRLISSANWNQSSAKHDAVHLKFSTEKWKMNFVMAYNQSDANLQGTDYSDFSSNYKTLNVFWLSRKWEKIEVSLLNILDGNEREGNPEIMYARYTAGPIVKHKIGKLSYEIRYFQQLGQNKSGDEVNAYFVNLQLGWKINDKMNIAIGNEYLSGNDGLDSTRTQENAFDILYGKKHSVNGILDYYNTPATTKGAGLDDNYLMFSFKPKENINIFVEYHYFLMQNNYVNSGEVIDKYLGSECDIYSKIKLSEDINLELGYGIMLATESAEIIKGGDSSFPGHFFYTMITVKPTFFNN